ncbi:cupin domain-containing protein [Ramlibacter sp. WS9]|uniref:cupin domain-containing protein n=1 Tax=Ramlibacter sp. WS9 TaxID=1882741 RepID=UPI0011438152|nr:cupin domain-containing protein [Ramlibacter sp. WS9]ROZ75388.1 cupin domain-containing protein [Ramlibacter sp. WS9]
MIIKKNQVPAERAERESFGVSDTLRLSDAGGLSQYGAYVQTLHPGARSSNNHWHENEDEFLYVLSGEVTVTEGAEAQVLHTDGKAWRLLEADGQLFKSGVF